MKIAEIFDRQIIPNTETEIILANLLKKDRSFVKAFPEFDLTKLQQKNYLEIENRLLNNEPLPYILGYQEFYGRKFLVNPNVLIPRPETESLVDKVLDFSKKKPLVVIDVGTGSGCVAITLKLEQPKLGLIATDISREALTVAKKNARLLGLVNKITFLRTNLLDRVSEKVDVIVANLPYIPTANWKKLPERIRQFEPKLALASGRSKDSLYCPLFSQAKGVLVPDGKIFYEIDGDIFEKSFTDLVD